MTQVRLEHVNISVSDPARTAQMLVDLFGWKIRWQGPAQSGGFTIHVGSDTDYLAVYAEMPQPGARAGFRKGAPLNHVGIEVGDLDGVERRVIARGLVPFSHGDYEPGRRFYFFDPDGIEYEVVSYAKA
ncbi:MAG: VOC family protein [Hyphomonas sp.]|uniref:VOC family protein n=1 Tax=Hyphomonas sp. TaxID=87 RepID=UPI0017E9E697|nr:VOC family protein [Hyphomonas sp.]MBU3919901.1 VOC family protein [Alphaproteobacteria bacterium]MBA3067405.1 VOC family protein [Hyphomonas sp.]MBU4061043.1 VOC family protein [Alphaproteobacteria bacterium]MBU4165899.1 VOC family protein [Alphaproteobacteria bacterium]MBU4568032.1 VOC family protein [Alphaproteobacteria bacterium]